MDVSTYIKTTFSLVATIETLNTVVTTISVILLLVHELIISKSFCFVNYVCFHL